MAKLFSKRNAPPPEEIRYDLPQEIRTRILAVFNEHTDEHGGGFGRMLDEIGSVLIKEYGGLEQSSYVAARRSDDPVIEHFYCCSDEQALDFVELCFRSFGYRDGQRGVNEINEIFREQGIGYQLTPYIEREVKKDTSLFGRRGKGIVIETEYPRAISRDHQLTHTEIVEPTLQLLASPEFRVANSEMLDAHTAFRAGNFEDAITLCGSAFESVLKTICEIKGWDYDPNCDTCSRLVTICKDQGLFPSFYVPIFEASGTIRNKLGDAHGRGPRRLHEAEEELAHHMLLMTSSHILLLARLSELE